MKANKNASRAILNGSENCVLCSFRKWALLAHIHKHIMGARFTEHKQGPYFVEKPEFLRHTLIFIGLTYYRHEAIQKQRLSVKNTDKIKILRKKMTKVQIICNILLQSASKPIWRVQNERSVVLNDWPYLEV
jgi:hypothetical protein